VMLQRGDGTLGPMSELASYDAPAQVELADVNGDGRRDVVVGHSGWYAVGVYLQQADGSLGAEARYPANYGNRNPGSMVVGDVTGDGRPDILVAEAVLRQKVVDVQALGTGAKQPTRALRRIAMPAAY
jgi:FG-GAP-like repeat